MTTSFPLAPQVSGRVLTIDMALNQPTIVTNRILALTADKLLIDKFLTANGQDIRGGGLIFTRQTAADSYLERDVEQRAPGQEYPIVWGQKNPAEISRPEDWGGKFFVTDEARIRNVVSEFDDDVTRLANTIVRKLNARVIAEIEEHIGGENTVPGHDWGDVVTVGPPDSLTPNSERPASDWANAQLAAELQELGYRYDTLILHPQEEKTLKDAYGENLAAALESAGLTPFSSPRVTPGVGYVVERGKAGVVAFERPLTTEVWREEATKRTWLQSYAIPAIAITAPPAIKKLTGLAG